MQQKLNLTLMLIIFAFLCGPGTTLFADKFIPGFDFPEQSLLEGKTHIQPKEMKTKSFQSGEFQDAFETFLAERIPFREDLLFLQAGLQRQGIATAAIPMCYEAYPTYYGANVIAVPGEHRLTSASSSEPSSTEAQDAFTKIINSAAQSHPDSRFAVDWILEDRQSSLNPSYALKGTRGLLDEDWVRVHNVEPLDDAIPVFTDSVYDSSIEPPAFQCDVHWTLERALQAYNRIAAVLDLEAVNWDDEPTGVVVERWLGNEGRFGLDSSYPNQTIDDLRDFSSLTFLKIGKEKTLSASSRGLRESVLSGNASDSELKILEYSGYSKYYGQGNAEIRNDGPNNGRNLLLIGDSYTYCLKRFFAMNYAKTYYVLPGNHTVHKSLDDYIDEYDIDDVIIMMQCCKADVIASKSPDFIAGVHVDEIDDEAL